jgi:hypothetical protein
MSYELVVLQRDVTQFGAAVRDTLGDVQTTQEGFYSLRGAQKWAEDQLSTIEG